MDIKSPQRNKTTNRSVPQNSGDIRTPKQNRTMKEITLSLMQARRTPIRSLNTSSISTSNRNIVKQKNFPVKRCFSQEVLDLSRRQMTTGKNSKAEIAHVPPKRIKMGDFIYTPKSSNSRRHESSSSNSNADLNVIQRKDQKRTQLQQFKLPLAPLQNNPKPNQREKDGVGNRETNTTISVNLNDKEVQRRAVSHFLVTVENFPLEIWRENNFDCRILREIIFQSKGRIVPVKTTRKDGQLTIELIHPNDPNFCTRVSPKVNDVKLIDFLRLPFGLSFRILAGVLRWIIGT